MRLIPAIDLLDGKCVQLVQGDPNKKEISLDNPLQVAKNWVGKGAEILWVVDLNAALGTGNNNNLIKQILKLKIPTYVAGGIRTEKIACEFLEAGAEKIVLGTKALDREFFKRIDRTYVPTKIIAALDCKGGKIVIKGWQESTGFTLKEISKKIDDLVSMYLVTNVDVEGKQEGPDFEFIKIALNTLNKPVLISGGISTLEDIQKISELGAYGVVLGTALYTEKLKWEDVKQCLQKE